MSFQNLLVGRLKNKKGRLSSQASWKKRCNSYFSECTNEWYNKEKYLFCKFILRGFVNKIHCFGFILLNFSNVKSQIVIYKD